METTDKVQLRGGKDLEGWVAGPIKGGEFKYYSAIEKNEIPPVATKWIVL